MAYKTTDGRILTESEFNKGVAAYTEKYGSDNPLYTKFEVVGKRIIRQIIQTEGCVGVRVYNIIAADGQTGICIVPVSADGKELPCTEPAMKDDGDGKGGSGSVKCPPTCKP